MRLIFMGTPEFARPALQALIDAGHEIVAVYTRPPKPKGRGQQVQKTPIHLCAEQHNIPVYTPVSLRDDAVQQQFKALNNIDATIVVAYGHILPSVFLEHALCLNIHASLLPKWRGAAPIIHAIAAGDKTSGISIIRMDSGLDTGDVALTAPCTISAETNAGDLTEQLSQLGADAICQALKKVANKTIDFTKQGEESCYATKISPQDAQINWDQAGEIISCHIRAYNPFPGAFFHYKNQKIKILSARIEQKKHHYQAGEIVNEQCTIATQNGLLYPNIVQRQGKKAMDIESLLRGFSFEVGDILSR